MTPFGRAAGGRDCTAALAVQARERLVASVLAAGMFAVYLLSQFREREIILVTEQPVNPIEDGNNVSACSSPNGYLCRVELGFSESSSLSSCSSLPS